MSDLAVIRRFARLLIATLRWRLVLVFVLGLVASLTAGIGLVLLVPLLSLIGIDTGGGSTEAFVTVVRGALDSVGVEPSAAVLLSLNAV
ncbi:MAG TPA: hypothetical protein VFD39_05030, partial [Trueperaceae bacterium]|nr:hypothetical protein [Trueperaceae bacterium]